MRIFVKAKPGAKVSKIVQKDTNCFDVWVHEKPQGGKANKALAEALAGYFQCSQAKITLIKRHTSRNKIFDVEG